MSFWDNVKKFATPYADEDYDDYADDELDEFEEEPVEAPRRRSAFHTTDSAASDFGSAPVAPAESPAPSSFSGHVVGGTAAAAKHEVVLFHAKAFGDATKAADELRVKKAVILNMENVDKALTRRVVDFLSGCVYAVDGKVKKIAQCTYLFCPSGINISGELEDFHGEVESYI